MSNILLSLFNWVIKQPTIYPLKLCRYVAGYTRPITFRKRCRLVDSFWLTKQIRILNPLSTRYSCKNWWKSYCLLFNLLRMFLFIKYVIKPPKIPKTLKLRCQELIKYFTGIAISTQYQQQHFILASFYKQRLRYTCLSGTLQIGDDIRAWFGVTDPTYSALSFESPAGRSIWESLNI